MSKIIFVSEVNAFSNQATSTHILTENILYGIKRNGHQVVFLALCESKKAQRAVFQHYVNLVDSLYVLKSTFRQTNNKYVKLVDMIRGAFSKRIYQRILPSDLTTDDDTILISHTPSIEAVFLCKALLHKNKVHYIQYWSDPIALSGIMPEQFGFKRKIFYLLEKHAFATADEIVFGTNILLEINSSLYPEYKSKMRAVDIAYLHKEEYQLSFARDKYTFIYAGNYYSEIRNIEPLYQAFCELGKPYVLHVYGNGNAEFPDSDNVIFHGRVSREELGRLEGEYRNTISLLNHSCMQIPGKTFYQMDTNQTILVIADGVHRMQILDYLDTFNRFAVCENSTVDIKKKIIEIAQIENYRCPESILKDLSPENISMKIVGECCENR